MSWYEELDQKMADYLPDVPVLREEPLSRHTSFRIGGRHGGWPSPKAGEQLVLLVSFARGCGARPFVLGNGTNLLFGDGETDRLVISTRDLAQLRRGGSENEIIAGAGVPARAPGGLCPAGGADGAGVRPRHPWERRWRGVHERGRL